MRSQQLFLQSTDRQYFAAQRDLASHGNIAAHSDLAPFVSQRVAELNHTQEVVDIVLSDGHVKGSAFLHYFARNLAANVTNLALEVTHASFPRIRADQRGNRIVSELQILFGESCL